MHGHGEHAAAMYLLCCLPEEQLGSLCHLDKHGKWCTLPNAEQLQSTRLSLRRSPLQYLCQKPWPAHQRGFQHISASPYHPAINRVAKKFVHNRECIQLAKVNINCGAVAVIHGKFMRIFMSPLLDINKINI